MARAFSAFRKPRPPAFRKPRPPPCRSLPQLGVDLSRRETLHINFDISFLALPCEALLMDVGDAAGKFQTESAMATAK